MARRRERPAPPQVPPEGRTHWLPGDEGHEHDADPPEAFFHVVAMPKGGTREQALVLHAAFELGRDPGLLEGRRYIVNASSAADARARVLPIEERVAEHEGHDPWELPLVEKADALLHAGRDPEPAAEREEFDPALHRRRRARAARSAS